MFAVNVTCDLTQMTATVCYTPQDGYIFDTGSAVMYAEGTLGDPACMGTVTPGVCPSDGDVSLVLNLSSSAMARCGTQLKALSVSVRLFLKGKY